MVNGESAQESAEAGDRAGDGARARLATEMASFALGLEVGRVHARERGSSPVAFARQLAMYLCHVGFEMSMARVALAFRRDRSTVSHACRLMEDRRDDPRFDAWLNALEAALREAPKPVGAVLAEARP
jgi:hypothetical protein